MSDGLATLEKKIDQILVFCEELRAENRALRTRVARMEDERGTLLNKIELARVRLEALMDKIPVE
ncbi:MAG: hypothetical protein KBD39_07600 [Sterolibacterium sp.]|nr:hypothetical protein [Sterolibacterium sp.]MBP9799968.1 hypothetical protein [Sterolibacterium sp.]